MKIEHLLDHPRVTFIEGSITDLLMETFPGADGIFAAIPSVPRSVKDPLASNEANVTGTLDVFVAIAGCRLRSMATPFFREHAELMFAERRLRMLENTGYARSRQIFKFCLVSREIKHVQPPIRIEIQTCILNHTKEVCLPGDRQGR